MRGRTAIAFFLNRFKRPKLLYAVRREKRVTCTTLLQLQRRTFRTAYNRTEILLLTKHKRNAILYRLLRVPSTCGRTIRLNEQSLTFFMKIPQYTAFHNFLT